MKRFVRTLLSLFLSWAFLVQPVLARPYSAPATKPSIELEQEEISNSIQALKANIEPNENQMALGRYIVQLKTPSLVAYDGEIPGIQKAPVDQRGKIILQASENNAYLEHVNNQIDQVLGVASRAIGRDVGRGLVFRYDVIFGGFAAEMSEEEAAVIAQLDAVKAVYPETIRYIETDVSPTWLGTTGIWNGDYVRDTGDGPLMTKGEGVLVGILDTGINMDHPSFAATGPVDGYVHTNPFGVGIYKGLCATNPTNYLCNDKLVGVYSYVGGLETVTGEDGHGHGSHTASTAVGNTIKPSASVTISGMAPHANLIAYDVCYGGACPDAASISAVQQALLDGVDVINFSIGPSNAPGQSPYSDPIELAFLEIVKSGGVVSTSAGNSGPKPESVWKGAPWDITVANTGHRSTSADVLASTSSRGPFTLLDVLEPEIAAPGTSVLASYKTGAPTLPYGGVNQTGTAETVLMSGTSMASPHVAGNAALLRALFPDWSGMEIKSALMMTALAGESWYTTPFDFGNGRLDMHKAALTGLVMNESYRKMVLANPVVGGDVKMLNIPSYQNSQCMGSCSFTRKFRSVADVEVTYTASVDASTSAGVNVTVEPASFTIKPGHTKTVTITIDASAVPFEIFVFGRVTFSTSASFSTGEPISSVAIPFAVRPIPSTIPGYARFNITSDQGTVFVPDVQSIAAVSLVFDVHGLTQSTISDIVLSEDPTPNQVYDNLDSDSWKSFTVEADSAVRYVFEVLQTSAGDLDLYFGFGDTPSQATQLYYAATVKSLEYLNIPIDSAAPQTYWVLVQNWEGTLTEDSIKISEALVSSSDVGNLAVVPVPSTSILAQTPYDLEISYNLPATTLPATWYGHFDTFACVGVTCVQIGSTDVDFVRSNYEKFYYFPIIYVN